MSADAATAALAADYLTWFVPAMALQFAMVAMGSALRAIGNFKTGTVVGTVTVVINMICAPILIFGWGTGYPLGVAGAAISSLIAIVVGNVTNADTLALLAVDLYLVQARRLAVNDVLALR